jgi:hypothetical protein
MRRRCHKNRISNGFLVLTVRESSALQPRRRQCVTGRIVVVFLAALRRERFKPLFGTLAELL